MGLQQDQSWFEQNRMYVAQQYPGQFVVVKDQSVRGAFPTFQDAYGAGVAMFGTTEFLVQEAVPVRKEIV